MLDIRHWGYFRKVQFAIQLNDGASSPFRAMSST